MEKPLPRKTPPITTKPTKPLPVPISGVGVELSPRPAQATGNVTPPSTKK